jgi:hypothetical protein
MIFPTIFIVFFFPATFDVDGCTFRLLFIVSPYTDDDPTKVEFSIHFTSMGLQDPDFSKLEPITVPASMGLGILAPSPL